MTFSCFLPAKTKHLQSDLSQFPFPLRTHLGSLALTRLEYQTRHGCKRTKKSDVLKVLEENTWIIIESFTILHSSQNVEILQENSLCLVATCPDVQQITRILCWLKFQLRVNTRTKNMRRQVKPTAHSKFNTHLKQQITQANTSPFTET